MTVMLKYTALVYGGNHINHIKCCKAPRPQPKEWNINVYFVRVVKSRRMRWAGHVARMGEGRGAHRVLVGKPEGKRPLGRPRRRWEDNIKTDPQEMEGGYGDWMVLSQGRDWWWAIVNTVMNFRFP
jgi:hypothetical protein